MFLFCLSLNGFLSLIMLYIVIFNFTHFLSSKTFFSLKYMNIRIFKPFILKSHSLRFTLVFLLKICWYLLDPFRVFNFLLPYRTKRYRTKFSSDTIFVTCKINFVTFTFVEKNANFSLNSFNFGYYFVELNYPFDIKLKSYT